MGEAAREAEVDDLAAICAVAASVRADLDGARGAHLFFSREHGRQPTETRLAERLADGEVEVLVGTYDGVVFGYAVAVVEELTDGRSLGIIEDLAVDPAARASGIGEAMMNLLLERLAARGCFGVDANALPGDRHTKNFFESFGLKARLLTVHRELDDR